MRGTRGEDAASFGWAAWREYLGAPVFVAVEPPQQPNAIEAGEVLQGFDVFVAGDELEDVGLRELFVRLVAGVELQRLPSADMADGAEGEFVGRHDRAD